jgi:hypothetical protein
MYIRIRIHTYIYIYVCIYTCTYIYIYIHIYIYMHIQVNGTSYMDRAVVGSMSMSGSVTMQVSALMYVLHKLGACTTSSGCMCGCASVCTTYRRCTQLEIVKT